MLYDTAQMLPELIDEVELNMAVLKRLFKSLALLSFDVLLDIAETKAPGWNISKELLDGRLLILAVSELLDWSRSRRALLDLDLIERRVAVYLLN